jgi:hypothetical protein
MNEDERGLAGLSNAEQDLVDRLGRLGPLIQEQERFEAEIDQAFARNLRAHLVAGEDHVPYPRGLRSLRSPLLREAGARPAGRPFHRRLLVWIGAATAAVMALVIGLILAVLLPQPARAPSFGAPYPTRADLLFSFPAPPVVIHRFVPTISLVHPRPGVPYAGRLRLRAPRLPKTSPTLRAYRLAPLPDMVAKGRRLLGIRAPVRHVVAGAASWMVAADGGPPSRRPLHSLAVSLASGELIYHDRRNHALPRATGALARSTAIAVARHWLARLGWPGNRMPLVSVERAPHMPKVREVEFAWIGVGRTATAAATLWVTPDRSVIEAWVWPPVAQGGVIPARSEAAAWSQVRQGKLPLAVEGVSPSTRADGRGTLRRTSVVSILTPGRKGVTYLVPTYRFEGKAHIPGASTHTWYTLAPGARK